MAETPRLKVLFLCTGNSCRSQMAEAWARALKADQIEPYSAGVSPHGLDPRAVAAMAEVGIDISHQKSKDISELGGLNFDWVITLCDNANQNCPFFPGPVKRMHAGFDDPPLLAAAAKNENEAMAPYRRVREEIKAFVQGLPQSLGQNPA